MSLLTEEEIDFILKGYHLNCKVVLKYILLLVIVPSGYFLLWCLAGFFISIFTKYFERSFNPDAGKESMIITYPKGFEFSSNYFLRPLMKNKLN